MPQVPGPRQLGVDDLADQCGPHPMDAAGFTGGNEQTGRWSVGCQWAQSILQVPQRGLTEAGADLADVGSADVAALGEQQCADGLAAASVAALPADDDRLHLLQMFDLDPAGAARSG